MLSSWRAEADADAAETDGDVDSVEEDDGVFRISIEILVPTNPRNCERAAVRYVRVVNGSSRVPCWGWACVEGGWFILSQSVV